MPWLWTLLPGYPFSDSDLLLCTAIRFVVVVHLLSHVLLFAAPRTAACQASLSFTIFCSLLKLMSIELVMPPYYLIPFSSCLQSFPASGSFLAIRWSKYWNFSFSISFSNEYSGLISFRIDWFDLLAVQGTLVSLL